MRQVFPTDASPTSTILMTAGSYAGTGGEGFIDGGGEAGVRECPDVCQCEPRTTDLSFWGKTKERVEGDDLSEVNGVWFVISCL